MNQHPHDDPAPADSPWHSRIYSAPRRFNLATILVVTSALAALLTGMHLLEAPPITAGLVAGFVCVVGIAQAWLYGGKDPRRASMVMGALMAPLAAVAEMAFTGRSGSPIGVLISALIFAGFGYLAGTLVGGVFLVAEMLHRLFVRR